MKLSYSYSIAQLPSKEIAYAKMPAALSKNSLGERRERWRLVLVVILPFAVFYGTALLFDGPVWSYVVLLLAFLYWSLLAPRLMAREAVLLRAKSIQRLAPHNGVLEVTISQDGVSVLSEASKVEHKWIGYSGLTQSQSGAFLWFGFARYVFVPNEALPEHATWAEVDDQMKVWRDG